MQIAAGRDTKLATTLDSRVFGEVREPVETVEIAVVMGLGNGKSLFVWVCSFIAP